MSRIFLAIEASSDTGSIAIGTGDSLLAATDLRIPMGHSAQLLAAADRAMATVGISPGNLDGVIVGSGPGSFTGLRIAGATAKGIARARGIPFFAVSSLLATAAGAWSYAGGPVCALVDARHRDIFYAVYRFGEAIEVVSPPAVTTVDTVIEEFAAGGETPLFIGTGAQKHRADLEAGTEGRVAPPHFAHPRAAALIWLVTRAGCDEPVANVSDWQPEYLRTSGAERIAAARSVSRGER